MLIGSTDYSVLEQLRQIGANVFKLCRIDIFATRNDDVFLTIIDVIVALIINVPEVTGSKPIAIECGFCEAWFVEVITKKIGPANLVPTSRRVDGTLTTCHPP